MTRRNREVETLGFDKAIVMGDANCDFSKINLN